MTYASIFVNSAFKAPTDRAIDAIAAGVAAGATSSDTNTTATLTSNELLAAGLAVNNITNQTAERTDSAILGASNDYTGATGRDVARASASDISRRRVPELSGTVVSRVVPQEKISSGFDGSDNKLTLLTEMDFEGPRMRILFGKYQRPNPFSPAAVNHELTVFLPLPTELVDMNQISYSPESLETVGDIANVLGAGGTGAGTAAAAALMRNSQELISSFGSTMAQGGTGIVAAMGSALRQGSKNIATVLEQAIGVAPNPNPSMAFRGPTLRTYTYTWTFHPNNVEESRRLRSFIREVKKRALPAATIATNTALLNYPQMCQINLFPWDANGVAPYYWGPNTLMKYKKSVITSVNVNYAPNNVPAFFEGTKLPVFVNMSISFTEIEFFTSDDYLEADGERLGGSTTEADLASLYGSQLSSVNNTTTTVLNSATELAPSFLAGREEAPPPSDTTPPP